MSSKACVRPVEPVHRGSIRVAGYWFDDRALAPELLVRRLLPCFEPGSRVFSSPEGVVLVTPGSRQARSEQSPASCLVRDGSILSSAPLTAAERAALPPGTELALVRGGIVCALAPAVLEPVEPAEWLDLTAFEREVMQSLGGVPEPPERIADAADADALFSPRIGRTATDRTHQRELAILLAKIEARPAAQAGGGVSAAIDAAWRALKTWWKARSRSARPSSQSFGRSQARPIAGFFARIGDFFKLLVWRTRLMALLGKKQAEYLRNLLELLDRQQDFEVLKHAIPLSDGSGSPAAPALLPPAPRTNLEISLVQRGRGSAISVAGELMSRLRVSYEAVFQRLDRDGKVDEAAFVLAELLDDPKRAVAYLERQGRLILAAELAEARNLPAGLVVRQWFLAGNRQRAVGIAVRDEAFADAIDRLQRSGRKDEADGLRLLHADRLASGGMLVAAARTVKSIAHVRPLALRWLEVARASGDYLGVALELELDESRFAAVWGDIASLLGPEATGESDARARARLGEELLRGRVSVTRSIARELARELFADASREGSSGAAATASRLADWVGGPFRADQPRVVSFERATPQVPVRRVLHAPDVGSRPISDVCALGSRYVVALGEAGVALVARDGRRIAHFDLPAERLVVARDGQHVLAVARRGDACAVGRIHLGTRRSERWTELRIGAFAPSFDGTLWVVAAPTERVWTSELLVLDVVEERPSIVRRVPLFDDAGVMSIAIGERSCNVMAAEAFGPLERLRYDLPGWTLRARGAIDFGPVPDKAFHVHVCAADAAHPTAAWRLWLDPQLGYSVPSFHFGATRIELASGDLAGKPTLAVDGDHFVVTVEQPDRVRIVAGLFSLKRATVDVELEGAHAAAARLNGGVLVLGDDTGRLLELDVVSGRCLEDVRIA